MASPRPAPSAPQTEWDAYWAAEFRPAKPAVAKATYASSPGAFALDNFPSIHTFSRNQNRLMNEALQLYHLNPWVYRAENTISVRLARVEWHLETENGDTVEKNAPGISPAELAILKLLEKPSRDKNRRQLWHLTSRHLGLTGNAFWYLDQSNALGSPLQLLYLNPVRLTPRMDSNGNLLGWMLDGPDNQVTGRQGNPGVPLELNEILHFTLDDPDFGVWGIGIAEPAQAKIELDRLATHHEAMVFASGGRLTGIVTPKATANQEITDEQWKGLVREWRNVASDPDAAKRLIIAKGAVDFIQTSSNNEQLQLVELAGKGRDDILNAWGVPLSQIGVDKAAGLATGERNKSDEAILWQGVIEPRADSIREKLQYELLDRIGESGPQLSLVIETPEFDDQSPLFDAVQKAMSVPLTNDERRSILGLDPFDEEVFGELGQQVMIQNVMTSLFGEPPPEPGAGNPPQLIVVPPTTTPDTGNIENTPTPGTAPAKALTDRKQLLGLRSRLQPAWEKKVRAQVAAHLHEQRGVVSDNIRQRYAAVLKKPKDATIWWSAERWNRTLSEKVEPLLTDYATIVARRTTRTLKRPAKADGFLTNVLDRVKTKSGSRITGINDTTRDRVQELIGQGIEQGLGPAELGDLIEEDSIFDEARSELIARTETGLVYNDAALGSYSEYGVEEVEAIDGDDDEECADRNGQIFSVDEAESIEDHPNGTLDWVPVVKAELPPDPLAVVKAALEHQPDFHYHAGPTTNEIHVPEAAVHNTVNVPEQPAPNVTVNNEVKAMSPGEIAITSMPNRVHTAVRDGKGQIKGSLEGDA